MQMRHCTAFNEIRSSNAIHFSSQNSNLLRHCWLGVEYKKYEIPAQIYELYTLNLNKLLYRFSRRKNKLVTEITTDDIGLLQDVEGGIDYPGDKTNIIIHGTLERNWTRNDFSQSLRPRSFASPESSGPFQGRSCAAADRKVIHGEVLEPVIILLFGRSEALERH